MKGISSVALLVLCLGLSVARAQAPAALNESAHLDPLDIFEPLADYGEPLRGRDLNACIERLSRGENRHRVALPKAGLKRLAAGYQRWPGYGTNKRYGLFVDYTRNSRDKRAFLIDFQACDVLFSEYVIHGGTTYNPLAFYGDPNRDGLLDHCRQPNGSRQYMTRPGVYVTRGCHQTKLQGWPQIYKDCEGIKLEGLERSNGDAYRAGVVLHEHEAIPNDASMKFEGQGCPSMPAGALKPMVPYGLMRGALVLLYAPQCDE